MVKKYFLWLIAVLLGAALACPPANAATEGAKEKAQEKKAAIKEKRQEMKEEMKEKRADMKEKVQEKKSEMKEKKAAKPKKTS